jgi:hypothetical protein
MSGDPIVRSNGPYLRVVLPDFEPAWDDVWRMVEVELEEGVSRAEVIAPSYPDEASLAGVRTLVERLAERDVEAIVEWQGVPAFAAAP